jgi:hypothetical protein
VTKLPAIGTSSAVKIVLKICQHTEKQHQTPSTSANKKNLRKSHAIPFLCHLYWYRGVTVARTTAELDYLEVLELSMQILLLGQLASVRTVNFQRGRGYNSSTDLYPNTITSIQLQCIQAASPHLANKTTSKPLNRNIVCINLLLINLHTVRIYEINIHKREAHLCSTNLNLFVKKDCSTVYWTESPKIMTALPTI